MTALDTAMLSAHAADDKLALVALYTQAADEAPDQDAACFYLTHAYVFALETAHPTAVTLRERLSAQGRI